LLSFDRILVKNLLGFWNSVKLATFRKKYLADVGEIVINPAAA
jgi:hypothetical protein